MGVNMKYYFLLTLLMILSSISFSQTINGRLVEYEIDENPFDSTLFVTLQIRLNENENAVLDHAFNLKFDYGIPALQFVEGTYVNFNETDGYQTSTITGPGGSNTIQNIETQLVSGPGREVTDMYIDFVVFEFKIIDFNEAALVCPHNNASGFHFYLPNSTQDWIIGEWLCYEANIPVELASFTATSKPGNVILNWATASELNNCGFEIERKLDNSVWERINFVEGHGTTTEPKVYSYVDDISSVTATSIAYRLKQMDFDGTFEYSMEVYVDNPAPTDFSLYQNHPNPFNPVTTITFDVLAKANVNLKVFNSLGEEVVSLVNEEKPVGNYEVEFNAGRLSSGTYFYRFQAGSYVETKKMMLMK
jgi:hypothetical protein